MKRNISTAFTTASAKSIENQQWTQYRHKTGHGFAAEDANAIVDILKGHSVNKIGVSNELNGADRIVDGQPIQTKYCSSAEATINSAFDHFGRYRYCGQKLEVPEDQYAEAINLMSQKIKDGKVDGLVDPAQSKHIIKKGSVTYIQAKNIAKAGTIDSIIFDIKTQSIVTSYAFGISFGIQYANCKWHGMTYIEALKVSIFSAFKSGGYVLASGVISQQFLRTSAGRSFAAFTTHMSRKAIHSIYQTKVGRDFVHKTASSIIGKNISGAAAKNTVTKLLRTNALTAVVTTTIITIPDLYKASISRKISWTQFSKNLAVNIAGVSGGIAGAIIAAPYGSPGGPIGIGIAGLLGGIAGGLGLSFGAKKVADMISEDDSKKMFELVKESLSHLALDYALSEEEIRKMDIPDLISKKVDSKWLEKMVKAGSSTPGHKKERLMFSYRELEYYFEEVAKNRLTVVLPDQEEIIEIMRKCS